LGLFVRERACAASRISVHDKVTAQIVAALEKGVRPWIKPWDAELAAGGTTRPLRANGVPYRGVNVLLLWSAAWERGYTDQTWMTFKQALACGGCVRKGEKGSLVVYANTAVRTEADAEGDQDQERSFSFLKAYTVFNRVQVEGLPARVSTLSKPVLDPAARIAQAETFFSMTGADIRHGGGHAYYAPSVDRVHMPPFEAFGDPVSYYAVLAHEVTHWTKAKHRLDRDFGTTRFGSHGYAIEELVAELGAAFICADLGLTTEPRDDHAAYLQHWLEVMRSDTQAIFIAAAHAQRAADYLAGLQQDQPAPSTAPGAMLVP
jgi:antirestriction protein ArdC